ncbi:hypothetical protein EV361DRAFT_918938 [Lentinula raphanica]|uniref:CRIB domain-containing protein n=1 Tax=Lentinula raphanica TaxID=153919 RepID=A0AA38PCX3_9AGAR|nr:hypothetical protein F5878DRAFT_612724 [Lentinula raphanica]KAJ3969823.1 hypothetical protein EV361DRAFT_918938 [Lentinula raphanica]
MNNYRLSVSEASSIYTNTDTFTSSSTIPGLGSLSGKAIKRFGSAVVNGVDAILIRRRLAQIEDTLGPTSDGIAEASVVKSLYDDLLELSRPVYGMAIRTRAFRVIMSKVGGMNFEDLAQAIIRWPISDSYDLLKSMMACLRQDSNHSETQSVHNLLDSTKPPRLDIFLAAGNDAYRSRLPFAPSKIDPRKSLAIAFLMFIAFSVVSSSKPSFSRLVLEIDLLSFLTHFYPDISISIPHQPVTAQLRGTRYLDRLKYFPAHLTIHTLLEKLDSNQDALFVSQLQSILDSDSFHLTSDTLTVIRLFISQQHSSSTNFFREKSLGYGEISKTTTTQNGKFKRPKSLSSIKSAGKIDKLFISAPSRGSFEHVAHMGFDSDKGFISHNIDLSWTAFLDRFEGKSSDSALIQEFGQSIPYHAEPQSTAEAQKEEKKFEGARWARPPPSPSRRVVVASSPLRGGVSGTSAPPVRPPFVRPPPHSTTLFSTLPSARPSASYHIFPSLLVNSSAGAPRPPNPFPKPLPPSPSGDASRPSSPPFPMVSSDDPSAPPSPAPPPSCAGVPSAMDIPPAQNGRGDVLVPIQGRDVHSSHTKTEDLPTGDSLSLSLVIHSSAVEMSNSFPELIDALSALLAMNVKMDEDSDEEEEENVNCEEEDNKDHEETPGV